MRKMISIGMLVLTISLAAGCGDSVQNNMERAQIAVNHNKFDHALDLANRVLAKEPENVDAAHIKAIAMLRLGNLAGAHTALTALIKQHPDDVELHKLMVRWAVQHNAQILDNTALMGVQDDKIVINKEMMGQIDKTRAVVDDQAQWLANKGKLPGEAEYARAEMADLKSSLIGRHIDLLTNTLARSDDARENRAQEIKQLKAERETTLDDLQARLASALKDDPDHQGAALRYNNVLLQRKQWGPLWNFLEKTSQQKNIHEALASQMVLSLLAIPSDQQPESKRLALGWKLTDLVPTQRRQSVAWWLSNARLHMMAGQYVKAVPLLEQVRGKSPNDNNARYLLASCYYHQNQFKQADAILKKLSVQLNRSPNVALLNGMNLRQLGEIKASREAIRHAIELDPENPVAREQMILLSDSTGNAAAALKDLQAMYDRDPSDPRAIRFMLQYYRSQGDTKAVTDLMTRVEQLTPRRVEYLAVLIDGYTYLRQYKQAERTAREWVTLDKDKLEPHLVLARLLLVQNKQKEARAMIQQLEKDFAQDSGLEEVIGTLYLQQHAYDKAIEHLENVLAKNQDNVKARLKLAQAQYSLVLTDDALKNVQKVLESDPANIDALSLEARIYQTQGKGHLAAQTLAKIDTSKLDVKNNPLLAAQIKAKAEDYDAAISIANQAIFAGNDNPALRLLLAAVYVRKGNMTEAESQLLSLLRSQPDNWLAYSALATFYAENKMLNKGIGVFTDMNEGNALYTHLALAGLLARAKQPAKALDQIKDMLDPMIKQHDPRTMTVASVIASLYQTLEQPDRAREVYQKMIDAKLNVPQATLAQIDMNMARDQDTAKTAAQLESLLKIIPPEQKGLTLRVVQRLANIGKYDEALKVVDGWLATTPDDASLALTKGALLIQAGRQKEAVEVYTAAVKTTPDNAQLWLRLAQTYARGYDFPKAQSAYESLGKLGAGAQAASLTELGQLYAALGLNIQANACYDELDSQGNMKDPRVLFAMGLAAHAIGKDDVATSRFEQVPKASTLYGPAQLKITQIDQANGRTDQARQRLLVLASDRSTAVQAAQELVNLSIRDKNNEQIMRWSDQMLSVETLPMKQRIAWLNLRTALAVNRRDWTGASQAISRLAELRTPSATAVTMRILLAIESKQLDDARQLYHKYPVLQKSVLGSSVATLLGITPAATDVKLPPMIQFIVLLSKGSVADAQALISKIPAQSMMFHKDMLAATKRNDVSSPEFQNAMAQLMAAQIAMAVNMNSLAAQMTESVLKKYHSLGLAQSVYVESRVASGDTDHAMWQKVIHSAPGSQVAMLASSQVNLLDKKYKAAAMDVTKLLASAPDNEFVEYRLAGLLIKADDSAKAIDLLEKVVKVGGKFSIPACNDLAYMLAIHHPDRLDEAHKFAERARKAMPANPALLDTLGWIDHLQHKDAEALPNLIRASAAMKRSAEVHYHLGVVYLANGQKKWGQYHLQAAAALPGAKDIKDLSKAMSQAGL